MRAAYEDWVAAGKPCLRQACGHRHGDHIPSEAMECNACDCLRFVGFALPDDAAGQCFVRSRRQPTGEGDALLTVGNSLIGSGPALGFEGNAPHRGGSRS
jgi:hypothetical protein